MFYNIFYVTEYLLSLLGVLPRYSHGKAISLLRARASGGGQAGGLPAPHHQPAAEHCQDQPEQEAGHQDAPCHHHRLHRLLVSQAQLHFYKKYFLPKVSDIFPKFYQIFSSYRFLIHMIEWVVPTLGLEFNATQQFYYFSHIAKLLPVIHAMLNPIIYR